MNPKNIIASILKIIPLIFVLVWSIGSIFIKIALTYTDPFTFLLLRLILATSCMFLLALFTKAPWPNNWTSIKKIISAGLLLQFCYLAAFSYAVYYNVSPAIMTIILGLQPILTAVLSGFFLNDTITRYQWLGLALGLSGVIFVVVGDISIGNMTLLSFIFSAIALSSITVGSLIQKNNSHMNLLTSSTIQLGISIIPTVLLTTLFGTFKIPTDPLFLFSLTWVALVVSVGATCIYYSLLKSGHIISTTSLFYLVPPVTTVLCYVVFNEVLREYTILGLLLIVSGMFITNKREVNKLYQPSES